MSWCDFILGKKAQNFILVVIIINAITLGLETSPGIVEATGPLLHILDKVALAIFVVELILKMMSLRFGFVKDPWNIFDFVIVAISFVPATEGFTVLRSLRVLRVLRLLSSLPKLRLLVHSMLLSLPSIGWVALLMFVMFYIFSVMATKLFGAAFPDWFGSVGATFFTLFQVMTLESWSMGIARPVMEAFPLAWLFFVPFVLLSSFVVLNLFIAILVNGMSDANSDEPCDEEQEPGQPTKDLEAELAALRRQIDKIEAMIKDRK